MTFEGDSRKAADNIRKHGVPFDYEAMVFLDPYRLDNEDARRDYREQRRLTLGKIDGRLFAVAYAPRGAAIRLISARKANDREQRHYDEAIRTET